jgi:hypothetical protein
VDVDTVETPFGTLIEVIARKLDGDEKTIALKPGELRELLDVDRLLLGHPKHQPKELDEVLTGGVRAPAFTKAVEKRGAK